jgi:hypothetical protein
MYTYVHACWQAHTEEQHEKHYTQNTHAHTQPPEEKHPGATHRCNERTTLSHESYERQNAPSACCSMVISALCCSRRSLICFSSSALPLRACDAQRFEGAALCVTILPFRSPCSFPAARPAASVSRRAAPTATRPCRCRCRGSAARAFPPALSRLCVHSQRPSRPRVRVCVSGERVSGYTHVRMCLSSCDWVGSGF